MITECKNGETLLYYPYGSTTGKKCWYVKPDKDGEGRHIVLDLGAEVLTALSVAEEDLYYADSLMVPTPATCTNCGQKFLRKGTNDSWICDGCFYGEKDIKCTVCGKKTNDFYSPKSGVVCNDCIESLE